MPDWKWELIAKHENLTEGPAWDGAGLRYSEIAPSLTWRWDPKTGQNVIWRRDTNGANGMCFDRLGRLFACEGGGRRLVRYEKDRPAEVVADSSEGRQFNEPNDLAIDSGGRIYFSDPNYGGRPMQMDHESVWRADPITLSQSKGGRPWLVARATFDTTRPNGVLLSPEQKTLYVAESPRPPEARRQLRAYPVNPDGPLGDHRVLHDFGQYRGIDGMCVTSEGNIVTTAGNLKAGPGPMIYVFAPNGRVVSTHRTPPDTDQPTNCTYGGPALDELFVTFGTGHVYRVPGTGYRGHLLYPVLSGA